MNGSTNINKKKQPKGRSLDENAFAEVIGLLGDEPRRRDLLIEHLHKIQDHYGCLEAKHLRALAEVMRLSQAEVYEVASFYHHFDIIKEGEATPPPITVRVCDSLSCMQKGSENLIESLTQDSDGNQIRVLRAPCVGRCATAPVAFVNKNVIDHVTAEKISTAIQQKDFSSKNPKLYRFRAISF